MQRYEKFAYRDDLSTRLTTLVIFNTKENSNSKKIEILEFPNFHATSTEPKTF